MHNIFSFSSWWIYKSCFQLKTYVLKVLKRLWKKLPSKINLIYIHCRFNQNTRILHHTKSDYLFPEYPRERARRIHTHNCHKHKGLIWYVFFSPWRVYIETISLTSSAVYLFGRDCWVFEVHGEIGWYLEVYQGYGGERQHELGHGQADGEGLLGHSGRPLFHARLVQSDRTNVHHLDMLVH